MHLFECIWPSYCATTPCKTAVGVFVASHIHILLFKNTFAIVSIAQKSYGSEPTELQSLLLLGLNDLLLEFKDGSKSSLQLDSCRKELRVARLFSQGFVHHIFPVVALAKMNSWVATIIYRRYGCYIEEVTASMLLMLKKHQETSSVWSRTSS